MVAVCCDMSLAAATSTWNSTVLRRGDCPVLGEMEDRTEGPVLSAVATDGTALRVAA